MKNHPISEKGEEFRIALLASGTFTGVKRAFGEALDRTGIAGSVYLSPYQQYAQEILSQSSDLYIFDPNFIVLALDARELFGDVLIDPYAQGFTGLDLVVEEQFGYVVNFIEKLREYSRATILVHNLVVPMTSPLGVLEQKQAYGLMTALQDFNERLNTYSRTEPRMFVFDLDGFASFRGKKTFVDPKYLYLGDVRMNPAYFADLARAYMGYIRPLRGLVKKCLVLDLDNTLWGGIVGEDGIGGIHIGPSPEGRPYWEFQKQLLALKHRGYVLAINSKNNSADALRVIREHPDMVLREMDFATMQINWDPKSVNMDRLAEELNLGVESFVFFDDDPGNRALIAQTHPGVTVVDMPTDPSRYPEVLRSIEELQWLQLTEEDLSRNESYSAERQRKVAQKSFTLEEFLRELELEVFVEEAGDALIPRVAQLTQKTNQFNLTTNRYTEDEIRVFVDSAHYSIFSFRVRDKFGDYGVVGVVILKLEDEAVVIQDFLLSCRVLGKNVEFAILDYLIENARRLGKMKIRGAYRVTQKNAPASRVYEEAGFIARSSTGGEVWYDYDIQTGTFPVERKRNILLSSQ